MEDVNVALWLGLLLALLGFGGMALLLAIQCHHTATAEAALTVERRRNERLQILRQDEAAEHAAKCRFLVAVIATDTAEPADTRCN